MDGTMMSFTQLIFSSILIHLDDVKINTAACIDKSKSKCIWNGSMCYISCEMEELESGQNWTIKKTNFFFTVD